MKALISLLIALLISALAIAAYNVLPMRRLSIVPGEIKPSLFADSSGTTQKRWVDEEKRSFRCHYAEKKSSYKYCGVDFALGDGGLNGMDLSHYQTIQLSMEYRGEARVLRFYARQAMRDLPPSVSEDREYKYLNVFIPVNDLKPLQTFTLTEFSAAEWWLRKARLPRELSQVEFTNITNIGIDPPYPAPAGNHDFTIHKLVLEGPYISRENWYLCVMGCWFLLLLGRSIRRYQILRYQAASNQHMLENALDLTHQLEEESERYRELSQIDPLTKIYNRRGITLIGEQMVQPQRHEETGVVMIDVDYFKRINDQFGHETGDCILCDVARTLERGTRASDRVGRWGGEEFLLVCPDTTAEQVLFLVEHLVEKIRAITAPDGQSITVSFGIADTRAAKLETAVHQADVALYAAKSGGRDRACVYESTMD